MPFTNLVVKLACALVKDKKAPVDERFKFQFIDERLLSTPPIAAGNTKKEIVRMAELAKSNINGAIDMLLDNDLNVEPSIRSNEEVINSLNKDITKYLTKLMGKDLSDEDDKKVSSYFRVVSDVERVGDYAENVLEYALKLREEGLVMSEEAKVELKDLTAKINTLYDYSITAFDDRNVDILDKVNEIEDQIDDDSAKLEEYHIDRVKKGLCNAQVGSIYLQTVSNLERVGDHITNIALSIKRYRERKA